MEPQSVVEVLGDPRGKLNLGLVVARGHTDPVIHSGAGKANRGGLSKITRASASLSPACTGSAPESRSATASDLAERLSMPPRAALVPKRQFRDRPVVRQPPRAVRATCQCPRWHASAECHRAADARSACESPRRRQTSELQPSPYGTKGGARAS